VDAPLDTVDQIRTTVVDLAIKFGPRLFTAIVVLIVGGLIARWVGKVVLHTLRHVDMEPPVRVLLVRVARVLVFALFLIMALQNLGVELLPLIAGLGVAGAGIALALQGVLSNAAAGLTIIFTKPFRVGEYISIIGEEGKVESITLFNTTLSHPDLSYVVVPNRKIAGEVLHNYGKLRQLDISVYVTHDTNLDVAIAAIREVLAANPRLLREPQAVVRAGAFVNSGVKIDIRPWVPVTEYIAAGGEVMQSVAEIFRSRGIAIPVQQHEVRLIGSGSGHTEAG
jgi:small conductance mechanosensitive channel